MSETGRTITDAAFEAAFEAAQKSLREGGIPIGAALARGGGG
jgi:cytosine/creatinine deaminase